MSTQRNGPFVAWMLLWPLVDSLSGYLDFLANGSVVKHYTDDVRAEAALLVVAIWLIVGGLLYERRYPGAR